MSPVLLGPVMIDKHAGKSSTRAGRREQIEQIGQDLPALGDGDVNGRQQTERTRLIGIARQHHAAGFGDEIIHTRQSQFRLKPCSAVFRCRCPNFQYLDSRCTQRFDDRQRLKNVAVTEEHTADRPCAHQIENDPRGKGMVGDNVQASAGGGQFLTETRHRISAHPLIADRTSFGECWRTVAGAIAFEDAFADALKHLIAR